MSVLGEATLGVAHDDDARNMKRRTVFFDASSSSSFGRSLFDDDRPVDSSIMVLVATFGAGSCPFLVLVFIHFIAKRRW